MRIAVVYQGTFPSRNGMSAGERRVRDIARGLNAQDGVSVQMIVPRRAGDPETLTRDGLDIAYLGTPKPGIRARMSFWREARDVISSGGYEWALLYGLTVDGLWLARRLRATGVNLTAEFCDRRSAGILVRNPESALRWFAHRVDETFMPRMTKLNLVISQELETHVLHHAPDTPVLRLPALVDTDTFHPVEDHVTKAESQWGINPTDILFGYVGGLWKNEGVRYLVEAFAKVHAKMPQAKLIIAGRLQKGPEFDDVEAMRDELGLQGSLITPGWVATDDVRLIYSRADVMVLPQIGDAFSSAGLPTKLAEYSCMGKAVLATDVGDVGLYLRHDEAARLVKDEDADALAQNMLDFGADPALRKRLGLVAREIAINQFAFRQAGSRILAAIRLAATGTQKAD